MALLTAAGAWAQATPVITSVVNSYSFVPQVSPRGLASIQGSNLDNATQNGPGTSKVFVNGVSALIKQTTKGAFNSPDAVVFQVPPETPLGPAQFVVSNNGVSSLPFTGQVTAFSPAATRPIHEDGTILTPIAASPGETIGIFATGLGATDPPPTPTLTMGGFPVAIHSQLTNFPGIFLLKFAVPAGLGTGQFPLTISSNGVDGNVNILPVASNGLSLSQTGVTFRAVAGSANLAQRSIAVISTSMLINWTATPSTVSGGNWLQVSPATGTSDPKLPPPSITITADASKLAAGDYYGTISIRSSTALQVISVVLSVLTPDKSPGVVAEPTGVVFLAAPGGSAPPAKTVRISNPTTAPLTFTTSLNFSTAASWFQVQPTTATVTPAQPVTVNIQPNASLPAGVLTGSVTFTFSDATTRVVSLVAVVAAGLSGGSIAPFGEQGRAATCTPTKLLPVFTLLGVNFTSPVAWPANIEAFVVDDCGSPAASGSVAASFSNGDPPLGLLATQAGRFSGTWTPRNPVNANMNVTLTAQTFTPALKGTITVSGAAPANPNVPIVNFGGVVGTASYVASPAPGTLISMFGTALADDVASASALPLPAQLLSTQVILGGVTVPLVFVSGGQINAQVPYKLPTKATYQVLVQRGTAISTPESVAIGDGQPAVFTTNLSGSGQGHIYRITSAGAQMLAAPGAAVTAGDVVTIYCSGLGEVNPATVTAGSPAPLDVLESTVNPVTATIGDVDAKVLFAGLTPGFTGLYQVNLLIPSGVTPNDAAPLVLTVAGQVSQPVTLAVR